MNWLRKFFPTRVSTSTLPPRIFFYNALTRNKDLFVSLKPGQVTLYSCGPTVYDRAHIGNLRAYVFSDLIARLLIHDGFHVRRVINITDVGHLVNDADEGEDKMDQSARKEKTSPEAIANKFTTLFKEDLAELNIDTEHILFPKATEYIKEQIALAKTLEEKGFAYTTAEGLYFDTSKFPGYGKLGGFSGASLKEGARVPTVKDKRHPSDFALWRKAKPNDLQQWNSPWGYGNPGWHIECSAMSRALLGIEIDIHTGGEDHLAIHHNNEIAQSEAANGRSFVRYWMHGAFLTMQGEKASKSIGNIVYLSELTKQGYHPLALRYFFLQAQYRTPLSFSYDAISSADEALKRLWRFARALKEDSRGKEAPSEALDHFLITMRDDLSVPRALGMLWESLKNEDLSAAQKWGLLSHADSLLGISLVHPPIDTDAGIKDIPGDIQNMLDNREKARKEGDFRTADRYRKDIENSGYRVEDRPEGAVLTKHTE